MDDDTKEDDLVISEQLDVTRGSKVKTPILSGKHKGEWVDALVRNVNPDNSMDLFIIDHMKWNVYPDALFVPAEFVRTEEMNDPNMFARGGRRQSDNEPRRLVQMKKKRIALPGSEI